MVEASWPANAREASAAPAAPHDVPFHPTSAVIEPKPDGMRKRSTVPQALKSRQQNLFLHPDMLQQASTELLVSCLIKKASPTRTLNMAAIFPSGSSALLSSFGPDSRRFLWCSSMASWWAATVKSSS